MQRVTDAGGTFSMPCLKSLIILGDKGHWTMQEEPGLVNRAIVEFLD